MDIVCKSLIEWGSAARVIPGQVESGDCSVVKEFPSGVLLAVADGLGHGQEAAQAAALAAGTLENSEPGLSAVSMVRLCHERLRGTRGAVMSMAFFNAADSTMTWLGVGNVRGTLVHRGTRVEPVQELLLLRAGVLGTAQLPRIYASIVSVLPGDVLVFVTDGVADRFADDLNTNGRPQEIAENIMKAHWAGTDDALVLVARFVNGHNNAESH